MINWTNLGRNRPQITALGALFARVRKGVLTVLGIGKGRMVTTDAQPYMTATEED